MPSPERAPGRMKTAPLTAALTAVDRQMPVAAVVCNEGVPRGAIIVLAHWDDIAVHLLEEVRFATARTMLELEHLAYSISTKTLF